MNYNKIQAKQLAEILLRSPCGVSKEAYVKLLHFMDQFGVIDLPLQVVVIDGNFFLPPIIDDEKLPFQKNQVA